MNILLLILVLATLVGTQLLLGGKDFAFSFPGYGVLALAACASWWPARRRPVPKRIVWTLVVTAICGGYLLFRGLSSADHYLARRDIYLMLAALVVYLLVALNVTSARLRLVAVCIFVLLGLADAIIGILQWQRGDDFMPFAALSRPEYGWRASGFFGCPNHLAGFLEVVVMMGLGVTFWGPWRPWAKVLAGYVTAVCIVGIILTGSRGGFLSATLGLLAFICLSVYAASQQDRRLLMVLVASTMIAAGAAGLGVSFLARPGCAIGVRIASATSMTGDDCRRRLWSAALQEFQLSPVTGTGSGTYLYYGRQFRDPSVQTDPVFAHSDCLQLLAEYGLLGAVCGALFLGWHLWSGWRGFRNAVSLSGRGVATGASGSLAITAGALCGTVAFAAHSFVDFNLHVPSNALLVAFLFGVLANPEGEAEPLPKDQLPSADIWSPRLRLALPVLGLWIAATALPTFPAEYDLEVARRLLGGGQYLYSPEVADQIIQLADRGLRHDARNPELYYCLGEAHFALAIGTAAPEESGRQYEKAIAAYEEARRLAPRDVRLLLCETTPLDALQRFDEAEALMQRAFELDPNSVNVLCAHASHLYAWKKFPEAEAEYQKAAERFGSATARYWLDILAQDKKTGKLGALPSQEP